MICLDITIFLEKFIWNGPSILFDEPGRKNFAISGLGRWFAETRHQSQNASQIEAPSRRSVPET